MGCVGLKDEGFPSASEELTQMTQLRSLAGHMTLAFPPSLRDAARIRTLLIV
jgi:hypothetical protein